jgi:lysophospholipase L1-like esterase
MVSALACASTALGMAVLLPGVASASTRTQAENGSFGPACGDGSQPESTHATATGETVLFMNGDGCYVSFSTSSTTTIERVRWYAGGAAQQICGTFGVETASGEVARTATSCSVGGATPDDFQLATFASGTQVPAGSFKIVWHPQGGTWYDAHVDWVEYTPVSSTTRYEAENGTFGPPCGDGSQSEFTHGTGTGETVLFMNGDGCYVSFSSSAAHTPKQVRWFGGGQAGQICGTFAITQGSTEYARTAQSCSVGGASPDDFRLATFPAVSVPSGAFSIVWHPAGGTWLDAHVDWVETVAGGGSTPPTAPANDNFANATTVQTLPSGPMSANTAGATKETGEPGQCGTTPITNTVWYRLPAPNSSGIRVSTVGSTFNTVVGVYTGSSLATLVQVTCNDDAAGSSQSEAAFQATAGTTYWIQVGGVNGATGDALTQVTASNGPANDYFSAATAITTLPYSASQATTGATQEPGEPTCGYNATKTVWFRYTRPASSPARRVFANTFGSPNDFDTTLAVYTGSPVSAVTQRGCNDEARGTHQSEISWDAQPGVTYSIQVAGFNAATGTLSLQVMEGMLLAIGDSVVAGHGVGANPNGFPNNPAGAYSQLAGNDLHLNVANYARSGSCISSTTVGGDPNTPASCTKTIMGDQLPAVAGTPTNVVIGVGANDIEFSRCVEGFIKNNADKAQCEGTALDTKINAYKNNLDMLFNAVKGKWRTATNPGPFVTVVGYYNPFPAAPSASQWYYACDMWFPALDARDLDYAGRDHHSQDYMTKSLAVQAEAYTYAVNVLNALNGALSAKAAQYGATFVSTIPTFSGHDMCAQVRGGSAASTYVFGPEFTITYDNFLTNNHQSYTSRSMGGHCDYPQQPGDNTQVTSKLWYQITFSPNCLPHPTAAGQRALADVVKPSLTLP